MRSRPWMVLVTAATILVLVIMGVGLRVMPFEREPTGRVDPSPTPSARPTQSAASSPTQSVEPSPSPTQSAAPSPTESAAPSASPSQSAEPSPSPELSPSPSASPGPTPDPGPIAAVEAPCPELPDRWSCVTLTVPVDHFRDGATTSDDTFDVTFALRRATGPGPALGTFVTATGGPGTSGISSAEGYTSAFDARIRQRYDIVFFDQRGIGLSGPALQCPDAVLAWYTSEERPEESTGDTGVATAARTFANDCVAELQGTGVDPAHLPFYGTRQAIADLEAFRIWHGAEQLTLYGESYGTQFVQSYAAAYPDRVALLFVDGPVDLTLSGPDYWIEGARAFDQVLEAVLHDCTTQTECAADVAHGDALVAYDELARTLDEAPIPVTHTFPDGRTETRELTAVDLENAIATMLYDPADRMFVQRAVAAASNGDLWHLDRLAYLSIGQDPDTLEPILDETYSDALYYAVECNDYAYFLDAGDEPAARAQAYLEYGREAGIDGTRIAADYYGDLPCVFWPGAPPAERPAGLVDTPYPMVVLGATLDPATPWANGERIAERNAERTLRIVTPGGPHIIFGRGESCPDDAVTRILLEGESVIGSGELGARFGDRIVCPGDVAADYIDLVRPTSSAVTGLAEVEEEILHAPDWWWWDGVDPLAFGCPFGGTIRYDPTDVGYDLALDGCAWEEGRALTGTGGIDDVAGSFTLDVEGPNGPLTYRHTANGAKLAAGEW